MEGEARRTQEEVNMWEVYTIIEMWEERRRVGLCPILRCSPPLIYSIPLPHYPIFIPPLLYSKNQSKPPYAIYEVS